MISFNGILRRNWEDERFKKLHSFLQMIAKIDTVLEDLIYKSFNILNCDIPIKDIVELENIDFEQDYLNIITIIKEYESLNDDSDWNKIYNNWEKNYKSQMRINKKNLNEQN